MVVCNREMKGLGQKVDFLRCIGLGDCQTLQCNGNATFSYTCEN